jgi:hypothetical protein
MEALRAEAPEAGGWQADQTLHNTPAMVVLHHFGL